MSGQVDAAALLAAGILGRASVQQKADRAQRVTCTAVNELGRLSMVGADPQLIAAAREVALGFFSKQLDIIIEAGEVERRLMEGQSE